MRTLLMACITVCLIIQSGVTAYTADLAATDLKIQRILANMERQRERIRLARETADSQMSLAKIRIAERLRLSEEDLARQVEVLNRMREQLSEVTSDARAAMAQLKMDGPRQLDAAFAELDRQLSETNSLLTQMETIRENLEDRPFQDSSNICPTCPKVVTPPGTSPQESSPRTPNVTTTTDGALPQSGGSPFARGPGSGQ